MIDPNKAQYKCGFELQMIGLAMLHRYYLAGIAQETFSEIERARAYRLLEGMEAILVQSGYMTDLDIKMRHEAAKMKPASDEAPLVWVPGGVGIQ